MRDSGTIAGRTPRDRSDYTRMDQRIDAMIQDSQVESLVEFAQEHSGRVGDMLGNYRLGTAQWEAYNSDLLRKLLTLTWDRLDLGNSQRIHSPNVKNDLSCVEERIVNQGRPSGDVIVSRFDFQGDEIALDKTLESLIEARSLSYENIFVS